MIVLKFGWTLSILRILAIKFVFPVEKSWAFPEWKKKENKKMNSCKLDGRWVQKWRGLVSWLWRLFSVGMLSYIARQSVKRHLNVSSADGARLWLLTLLPFISCLFFLLTKKEWRKYNESFSPIQHPTRFSPLSAREGGGKTPVTNQRTNDEKSEGLCSFSLSPVGCLYVFHRAKRHSSKQS